MDTHGEELLEQVRARALPLLAGRGHVLAAVSGGGDSMALLALLHELAGPLGLRRIGIAHVNHGLRGAESDGDERMVRDMARHWGYACHVRRLSGREAAAPGMEAWGRKQRYRFFHHIARAHGYECIATGHTADDQIETVFMRLSRGAGLMGLRGILARRADGVIRPLLLQRRAVLADFLARRGIACCEDSSNRDCAYERNRFRHKLLAELRRRDAACVDAMPETALLLQCLAASVYLISNKWIAGNVIVDADSGIMIRRSGFCNSWVAAEALAQLMRVLHIDAGRQHIGAVIAVALGGRRRHLLSSGWELFGEREWVILRPRALAVPPPFAPRVLRVPGVSRGADGREVVVESLAWHEGLQVVSADNWSVYLGCNESNPRLRYRCAGPDEYFWPMGWSGPQRLRAFLKSQRVAASRRGQTAVVELAGTGIVWIPGLRVCEQCRVRRQSTRVLRMSVRPRL